ncbi:MAG TPA: NADPH-dependent FMN reductase [Jatrophihabitans sp.]|nr:NADPH-dependent FMN reductase [Jatrophihabitans sp.]
MKILVLCGSLRAQSLNAALARAVPELVPDGVAVLEYGRLDQLPYFNQDVEDVELPAEPARLRGLVAEAAAIVIACPEYAHGASGIMKNALEWLVGGIELMGKPLALVSASTAPTGGDRAQAWLRETLAVMGADTLEPSVLVPTARKRIVDGVLVDPEVRDELRDLLAVLVERAAAAVESVA